MADAGDPTTNLGFGFVVDETEPVRALGKIETAYEKMTKGVDESIKRLGKSLRAQNNAMDDVEDAVCDDVDEKKKKAGKFDELTGALKENWVGLDRLGVSWDKFIKLAGALSVGALVVGVIAFFKKAFDAAVEFRRELSRINEQYAMTAEESRIVGGAVLGLADRFGKTRDEVISMTKAMLDLGLTPKMAEQVGTSFKELAKVTLDLSAATGISMESSAEFTDTLLRINRVPATGIRGISNALKAVADGSRISSDELVQFNKQLEPIFAHLSDMSGEARKDFTVNMLGLAGALSDIGVDANKATGQFADMLDMTSESGVLAISKLSQFTRTSVRDLREMIKTNPAKVFDAVATSAADMDPTQLQLMARALEPLGLDFVDLSKLRKVGQEFEKGGETFAERAAAAAAASEQDEDLAKKAAKRQEAIEARMRRFSRIWENLLIQIGGPLADAIEPLLRDFVVPLFKDIIKWMRDIDWKEFFGDAEKGVRLAVKVLGVLFDTAKTIFDGIGSSIGKAFGSLFTAVEAVIALVTGDFDRAWELAKLAAVGALESVLDMVLAVPRAIAKAFGVDLDKAMKDVASLLVSPFVAFHAFILDTFDRILVYIGKELAPKLENFAKIIPKGSEIVAALKMAGESAEKRMKEREEESKREGTDRENVAEALAGGKPTKGKREVARPRRRSQPSQFRSPILESASQAQVELLKGIRDGITELATTGSRTVGGLASNMKLDFTLTSSGL